MPALQQELALVAHAFDQTSSSWPTRACSLSRLMRAASSIKRSARSAVTSLVDELVERVAVRAVFVRVAEHADVVEARPTHELAQRLEVLLGLARVADDERGADAQVRHVLAQALDQRALARRRCSRGACA